MSYYCPVCNKESRSFSTSFPNAYCQCTSSGTEPLQSDSANTRVNSQLASEGISQGFSSASSHGSYGPNHYSPSMEEPYLYRNDVPTHLEQYALTSPFFTSMSSGYPVANSHMAEPSDPSMSQGFPSYTIYRQEPYIFNAHTNPGYSQLDTGFPQHSVSATHSESFHNPAGTTLTNEKPHACRFGCGKSFRRKGDMERHAGVHSAPTLWCQVADCNSAFYRKDKLDEHVSKKHRRHY